MIEVEVKLVIGHANDEARRFEALGVRLVHSRAFEENILLDVPEGAMGKRGAMLRIRRYGDEAHLTYKEPARGPEGFKVRREIETAVNDSEALLAVLEAAGLRRTWRYTKWRTVYAAGPVKVLLDETPIGNYLEIEGPSDGIVAFAGRLGRAPAEFITASYRELMARWCAERGRRFGDMVFPAEDRA